MPLFSVLDASSNSAGTFRLGIVAGFILYSIFGVLDYFMLPSNYINAWEIRFYFVGPSLVIPLILSFSKWFEKYINLFTILLLGIAQIGIFMMIFMAKPYEGAYYSYYMGLILVILWAAFIFKIKSIALSVLVLFTWIIYITYAILFQKLTSHGYHAPQFAYFFNNSLFLISITSLAIVGNYLIDQYYNKLNTENANLEKALQKAQESDQIKSNFLSTMSHEIRTPLNGIIGFSDIMIHENHHQNFDEMAKVINRQGIQLLNIVDSILQYVEIQNKSDLGEKTQIKSHELLHVVHREFDYVINKFHKPDIELKIQDFFNGQFQYLYTYKKVFFDIVKALLENAVKFSESGEVSVIFKVINDSDLILQIKDEGIGISIDKSEDIFDHFYQIESGHNRKYEGIGMGLSFTKKVVDLMDGKIWYEKNEGPGSSFYIYLPKSIRKA